MLGAAFVDDRRLDIDDHGLAGNSIESQIPQVLYVSHGQVQHHVVPPVDQEGGTHLRNRFHVAHESLDHFPFVLRELDVDERLQPDADCFPVDLRVRPGNRAGRFQAADAFMACGRGEVYRRSDLLICHPCILLKKTKYIEVSSVKSM